MMRLSDSPRTQWYVDGSLTQLIPIPGI